MTLHHLRAPRRASKAERAHRRDLPTHMPIALRERCEATLELLLNEADKLIRYLDMFDGDTDFEQDDSDREPNTGQSNIYVPGIGWVDDIDVGYIESHGEGGSVGYGDSDDFEPSLAHTNGINQDVAARNLRATTAANGWAGQGSDLEDGHDGREPSLCIWGMRDTRAAVDETEPDHDNEPDETDGNITTPTSDTAAALSNYERERSVEQWRRDSR